MKQTRAEQAIALLSQKAREAGVPKTLFKLWSVGEFPDVRVTSTPKVLRELHHLVDTLIQEHNGIRYADVSVPTGMLGRSYEVTFCFKLDVT